MKKENVNFPCSYDFDGIDAKLIPDSLGYYASKCGTLFSMYSMKDSSLKWVKIKPVKDRYGYHKATVKRISDGSKIKGIHRWVCLTYFGESTDVVNHKNFNRTDNRLENLEFVSCKQNSIHSRDKGRLFSGHQFADDCKILTIYTLAKHTCASDLAKYSELKNIYSIRKGETFKEFFDKYSPYERGIKFSKLFGGGYHKIGANLFIKYLESIKKV